MLRFCVPLLAIALVLAGLFAPGGIRAVAWQPGAAPALVGPWAPNDRLAGAVLEQAGVPGPDTVVVGPDGYRYSAIAGGRVIRWEKGGPVEDYVSVPGRPVGMNFGPDHQLYLADEETGTLWRIAQDRQLQRLADRFGTRRFNMLNDVWIASDGRVFFTESTARWPLAENRRALLEHGGDGGVFVWHPDGRVEQVLGGLEFANGVILSPQEDYLLVVETGAYRVTRLWLSGPRAGEREALLDNLPGFPGDLSLAGDGESYWCSFFSPRSSFLDRLGPLPWARTLVARLPLAWLPQAQPFPFVFRFDSNGHVLETLQDASDPRLPSFSSVVEADGELLLGTPGGVGAIDSDQVYRIELSGV
jgi:sugar lactone lactonase YvrE